MNRYFRRHPVTPFLPISYKERVPDLHIIRKKAFARRLKSQQGMSARAKQKHRKKNVKRIS